MKPCLPVASTSGMPIATTLVGAWWDEEMKPAIRKTTGDEEKWCERQDLNRGWRQNAPVERFEDKRYRHEAVLACREYERHADRDHVSGRVVGRRDETGNSKDNW